MKLALYQQLCKAIKSEQLSLAEILERYRGEVAELQLEGVYYRVQQVQTRKLIGIFNGLKLTPSQLWQMFLDQLLKMSGGTPEREQKSGLMVEPPGSDDMIIASLAKQRYRGVSPCYLARLMVKGYWEEERAKFKAKHQNAPPSSLSLTADSNESSLDETPENKGEQPHQDSNNLKTKFPHFTQMFRQPDLIAHTLLSRNVTHCHTIDPTNAPFMDLYRSEIGRHYEERLRKYLYQEGIAYLSEEATRRLGYSKTPDAILLEPIAITTISTGTSQIVKWIESKAWFGDPASHAAYLRDQYWPYYNRFGPGLVIYWYGFVEESMLAHQQHGIAVMEEFPTSSNITRITLPLMDIVKEATNPIQTDQGTKDNLPVVLNVGPILNDS